MKVILKAKSIPSTKPSEVRFMFGESSSDGIMGLFKLVLELLGKILGVGSECQVVSMPKAKRYNPEHVMSILPNLDNSHIVYISHYYCS